MLVVLAVVMLAGFGAIESAQAQGDPAFYCDGHEYGMLTNVPQPLPCDVTGDPRDLGYQSVCWSDPFSGDVGSGEPAWLGFPLNVGLAWGATAGDYPARKSDVYNSSSPLVPSSAQRGSGAGTRPERPLLGETIDLITGSPLLQEVDFELPFGGAVFRHVRTHGQPPVGQHESLSATIQQDPEAVFWDWQGQGWMMGEAPLFLIDAGFWGIVGQDEGERSVSGPRRCYFVLDAHHSIPFIWDSSNETYVAPAQFDALLEWSGGIYVDPDPGVAGDGYWATPPTEFTVWLHRQTVKYTIKPFWGEDVGPQPWLTNNLHAAPPDGNWVGEAEYGPGVPYFGLVTAIEDNYGHRIEFEYCDFRQFSTDDAGSPDCNECAQNCYEKGQLKLARLITNYNQIDEFNEPLDEVVWSLLYIHRSYDDLFNPMNTGYVWGRQQSLHAVYAYDFDIKNYWATNGISEPPCLSLDASHFAAQYADPNDPVPPPINDWDGDGVFDLDDIDLIDEQGLIDTAYGAIGIVPESWTHLAKYMYSDRGLSRQEYRTLFDEANPWGGTYTVVQAPYLIKSQVFSRLDVDTVTSNTTLYRYGIEDRSNPVYIAAFERTLRTVFRDTSIQTIIEADTRVGSEYIDTANDILQLKDSGIGGTVGFDYDPGTGEYGAVYDLIDLADQAFLQWDTDPDYGTINDFESAANIVSANGFGYKMLDEYVGLDKNRMVFRPWGAPSVFVDRDTSDDGQEGFYRIYRFLHRPAAFNTPDAAGRCQPSSVALYAKRTMFHFPYRYIEDNGVAYGTGNEPALHEASWVTVIDRYSSKEECEANFSANTTNIPLSRRVVEMNASGFVIGDRTWAPFGSIASNEGARETFKYDSKSRLIQKRTIGWGSAGNLSPVSEGLIYVFGYDDMWQREPARVGIRRGEGSGGFEENAYWLSKFVYDDDRSSTVLEEWVFPSPVPETGLNDPLLANITRTLYTYRQEDIDDPSLRPREWRIQRKVVVKPPAATGDGPEEYHGTTMAAYDQSGRGIWKGYGRTLLDTGIPIEANGDQYFLDYAFFTDLGVKQHDVHDAVPGTIPGTSIEVPEYPGSFVRLDPGGSIALSYLTQYEFVSNRPRKVTYPNGRTKHMRYRKIGSQTIKWVYNDIVSDGATFKAYSPVEISYYDGGKLTSGQEATVIADGAEPHHRNDTFTIISTLTPSYDAQGSVTGLVKTGEDGQSVSAKIQRDYFGHVSKETHPDGTLMRTLSDPLGRPDRTFRGTKDQHVFWGTDTGSNPDDDMVIIQKNEYGTGFADANQLVQVRHFREKPSQQYPLYDGDGNLIAPNNEDEYGWIEAHLYDWRMRDIWVTQHARGVGGAQGSAMAHRITFLDHLGRPRFVASYGPMGPAVDSGADPRALGIGDDVPSANTILGASDGTDIIGLSETIYNDRGQVQETRRYDVSAVNGLTYLSDRTFYDQNDKPLETISSGGGKQIFTYDAKGRQTTARTYAADWEILRTETYYDSDGNPEKTISYERMHDADPVAELVLTSTNSVVTYSFSWFNPKKQMIATASVGTASVSGDFTNRITPIDFGNGVPTGGITGNPPILLDIDGMLSGVDASGFDVALLDSVQISAYEYDDKGRQVAVARSSGAVSGGVLSRTSYDDLGNVVLTIENAGAAVEDQVRTGYFFDENNRLTKIAAVLKGHVADEDDGWDSRVNWAAADNTLQITEFVYGADVIDESTGAVVSANNGLIGQVKFPDPLTGQPNATTDLTFTYYTDGTLATRTDARSGQYTHLYDELGRQLLTLVDDSGLPTLAGSEPVDRVNRIEYLYDTFNRLQTVTARSDLLETDPIIAQNEYVYDSFGNLLTEAQQHGDVVQRDGGTGEITSPRIDYGWSLSSAVNGANHNRIASMTYPANAETAVRRTLGFEYGDGAADLDHLLSRLTTITDSLLGHLATYDHAGAGRRVGVVFGGSSVLQAVPGGMAAGGYTGLDRFGRVTDLDYADNAGTSLQRMEYAYDQSGNRLHALLTQQDGAGLEVTNERSGLYGYDGLDRLGKAESGALNAARTGLEPTLGIAARSKTWTMDGLGNWVGDATSPGLRLERDANGDGVFEFTQDTDHDVGLDNRIEQVLIDGSPTGLVYDASGSLVADGDYWYQYDAWGRQVRIDGRGTLGFSADGSVASGTPGPWIAHYTYDGLGRLIAKQSPWTNGTDTRTERYYYDGVRRVSETFTDPVIAIGPGELSVLAIGGGGTFGTTTWTSREYVYGSDYVDEFICQIDRYGTPFFVLQDGNYNVVGLTDALGQLLAQWTYDPYGEVLTTESFASHPTNRIGHQGLFADRLDGLVTDDVLLAGVDLLYQNRNRTYSPTLGRFLQKDPNQTAMTVQSVEAMNGQSAFAVLTGFDGKGLYGNGMSLYGYVQGNPLNRQDALGLFVMSPLDTLMVGMDVKRILQDMMDTYVFFLEVDMEIAQDWSVPDEFMFPVVPGDNEGDDEGSADFVMAGAVGSGSARLLARLGIRTGAGVLSKALRTRLMSSAMGLSGKKGLTNAGNALIKHPRIAGGPARASGGGFKWAIRRFGSIEGINAASQRVVARYVRRGRIIEKANGAHIMVGHYGIKLTKDGRFKGFLTGEFR